MAKRPTINTLTNTASPTYLTQLNQNFTNVRNQFDNTLSLDGSTPNAMNADIDLNNNDLINAASVNTATLRIGGVNVVPSAATALSVKKEFETVVELLASTLTYTFFAVDDYVRVVEGGFVYKVAASGASDQHVTTAGGIKLYILPDEAGIISFAATGAVSDGADHTTQWAAARAAATRSGAGEIRFPAGTFRISYASGPTTNLSANLKVSGAASLTIIKPVSADHRAIFGCDSGSSTSYVRGIHLSGLTFQGSETTPTFSEQKHLISLNGAEDAIIENCSFIGWRGDAIYLGSSDTGGSTIRRNRNIRIYDNFFDGINRENRQAVSVIDGDGVWFERNSVYRCTKNTMPGAFDMEPDTLAAHIIRNVYVRDNKFDGCGGNVGTVSLFLADAILPAAENIQISGNTVVGYVGTGSALACILQPRAWDATSADQHIRIRDNMVDGATGRPVAIFSGKGIRLTGNTYLDCDKSALVGYLTAATETAREVTISDRFIRCGLVEGVGVGFYNVSGVYLTDSYFEDCGTGVAGAANAIDFNTGTSERVVIENIEIVSPLSKTLIGIQKQVAHTFTPATNRYMANKVSLSNFFQAEESDTLFTSYTPVVEGATTAGSGTYTRQYGRWRRIGKQVFFEVEIVQTAHTGSGLIEISLPVQVAASSNNELRAVSISLDGVSTTGGQIGLINPAAVAGGVTGSIRCYHSGTGVLTQTTVPAGAVTYRAAGTYMAQ